MAEFPTLKGRAGAVGTDYNGFASWKGLQESPNSGAQGNHECGIFWKATEPYQFLPGVRDSQARRGSELQLLPALQIHSLSSHALSDARLWLCGPCLVMSTRPHGHG